MEEVFSTSGIGTNRGSSTKKEPWLKPSTTINPKWITDLNVQSEMIKLQDENNGENLCDPC